MDKLQNPVSGATSAIPPREVPPTQETIKNHAFLAAETGDIEALSHILDEYQFDLTAIDDYDGQTILHRAIAHGHDEMVKILLGRAGNDPQILDAKDRDGYTPLMCATAKSNVPLMQALVEVGARTDGSMNLHSMPSGRSIAAQTEPPAKRITAAALMLIAAGGDISAAFDLAVEYERSDAEKLYFDAGASAVPVMLNMSVSQGVDYLVRHGYIRADDVFLALKEAEFADDIEKLKRLTRYDVVSLVLDDMKGRSEDEKITALRRLLNVRRAQSELWVASAIPTTRRTRHARTEQQWEQEFKSPPFERARLMIAAGADSRQALVWQCMQKNEEVVKKMIEWGADAIGALRILRERDPQCLVHRPITNLLAQVELEKILRAENLPQTDKRAALRAKVLEGAKPAASALMGYVARTSRSLDEMTLLLSVGASPTEALMELGRSHYMDTARKLIHMGVDFFPAMRKLIDNGEQDAANVLAVAVALQHAPPGPGNPGKS